MQKKRRNLTFRLFVYTILGCIVIYIFYLIYHLEWRDYSSVRESSRITVYSNLPREQLDLFIKLYYGFQKHLLKTYGIENKEHIKVYLFKDRHSYRKYTNPLGGFIPKTPFGFYMASRNTVVCNCESGLGTLVHEFCHHLINQSVVVNFEWLDEGFSAFFENFIGIVDRHGDITLTFGYFSPWRFNETLYFKRSRQADLKNLIESKRANQSLARSFILFAHEEQKLDQLIENASEFENSHEIIENTFSLSLETIEKRWHRWIETSTGHPDRFLVKRSRIFGFEELKTLVPPLGWDHKMKRYIYIKD